MVSASENGLLSTMNSSWSQFINQFWQSRLVRSLLAIRIWSVVRAAMQARHVRIAHPFIQFILAAAFVVCRFYSPLQERDRRWKAFEHKCRRCSHVTGSRTLKSAEAAGKCDVKSDYCVGGSVCFRGSGLLLIYHIGVAQYLQDTFDLTNTRISGTSGGAVVAGMLAADVPMEKAVGLYEDMADLSNSSATGPFFTGLPTLLRKLKKLLPSDQTVASRCSDRLRLALTAVPFMEVRMIDQFPSTELLADAIISSMNLPLFLCPVPAINGEYFIDGALTPQGAVPKFDEHTVTISPTTTEADIYPQPLPSKFHFVIPGDSAFQKDLFDQGYQDAKAKHDFWLSRGFEQLDS